MRTKLRQSLNKMTKVLVRRIASGCVLLLAALLALAQQPAQAPQPAPAPPSPAQPAPAPPPQPAVTVPGALNLNNASLLEVINALAQDLHINYILDATIKAGSVTINTYGTVRDVDLRPLLETILRMNNLAMVQVGNVYRIIPIANIARQPVSPITQTDPTKLPDDERLVLNLIFLRYASSSEMVKILQPFVGDGGQLNSYDPGNLLVILDNSRNMRRTLELISLFDSDTFAGQRVRSFEVRNGRPTDIAKELETIFKAYALSDKATGAVRFQPIDRINTILAVAPNPGAFTEVEKWIQKLDIPAKVTAGSIDNYVYKLRYGRAEILGSVITQLYGGCGSSNIYGGIPGNSSYPASGYVGAGAGNFGGVGQSMYGNGNFGAPQYGNNGYGNAGYGNAGYGNGGYSGGAFPGGGFGGGFGQPCIPTGGYSPYQTVAAPAPTPVATAAPAAAGAPAATPAPVDQTGTYLSSSPQIGRPAGPRIVPNPYDNTLLVQGTPQEWEQIRNLLEKLDVPPRQVLIDAKIYEIDLSGDMTFGVESFLQKAGTTNPKVPAHQLLGSVAPDASGTVQAILTAGTMVGQSRQLLAYLQANETNSKTKVLSSPSVIATDSIPASITVGDSVPTVSSIATSNVQQNGNSLFTNSISNTSTGIGLNILARVNASGVVTMVINQNVTAPIPNPLAATGSAGSDINSPSFSQRNVSTQVTVQDGDTVAIGGIITDNATESLNGIPFLDRIPFIGFLFGTKTTTKQRTELIVFLTPRVIYDTTQMLDATEELKEKVQGLQKLMKDQ
jgi:general secretion pathway protein D